MRRTGVWRSCGSCGFFAVDFGKERTHALRMRLLGKAHLDYMERSALLGHPIEPLHGDSVLYVVNHGGNLQLRKGNRQLAYIDAHEVEPGEADAILAEFGVTSED
eukprot:TRINITY_DN71332_c0_g1_i1.p2 TRINITY_DN71332_c0_g1~~TRINITY_DN71332_c0_g1_i1.p2  ORF type:complete len:105 (-),score=20.86 TRINITY_DN71332_c0_g1_i1:67-381(-)